MQLRVSLPSENLYDQLLAVVEPTSDVAEPWGHDCIRRRIVANIKQHGPGWQPFIDFWSFLAVNPATIDGHPYFNANALQIDFDFYAFNSHVNIERNVIRVAVAEHFDGTLDEYYAEVKQRNARVQSYVDKWDRGDITRNDIRRLSGLPWKDEPFFNERLTPDTIEKARHLYLHNAVLTDLTRNMIV